MRYTHAQFMKDFPNEDVCLDTIFQERYGDVKDCPRCGVIDTKFYRVTGRKCYACMHCSYQLHPLAETIFHKSSTPLKSWFYAIYLFSVSKNGVAAKELERHLGVTYKTAHRMARQIRSLMGRTDKSEDLVVLSRQMKHITAVCGKSQLARATKHLF
jgi:transposase